MVGVEHEQCLYVPDRGNYRIRRIALPQALFSQYTDNLTRVAYRLRDDRSLAVAVNGRLLFCRSNTFFSDFA